MFGRASTSCAAPNPFKFPKDGGDGDGKEDDDDDDKEDDGYSE